jgi:hypothetical protein
MNHNYHRRYGLVANANISLDEAWELCQQIPAIRKDYAGQAELYQWPEALPSVRSRPHWAYWFTRYLICAHWPGAEDFTLQAVERFT